MSNIRTDLASELREESGLGDEDGIREENVNINGVDVKRIEIMNDSAAQKIGRNKGKYISVNFDGVFTDDNFFDKVCEVVKSELTSLTNFENKETLVIGLGNAELTADALGPKTISKVIASRHLKKHTPELFNNLKLGEVSTLTTSVLGKTGIESFELVKATVEQIQPKVIIVIDALAAREMKRLCTTLQITDTGICPGSGVGNNREELSEKTLGITVISVSYTHLPLGEKIWLNQKQFLYVLNADLKVRNGQVNALHAGNGILSLKKLLLKIKKVKYVK